LPEADKRLATMGSADEEEDQKDTLKE
jgi:hypothetical protein